MKTMEKTTIRIITTTNLQLVEVLEETGPARIPGSIICNELSHTFVKLPLKSTNKLGEIEVCTDALLLEELIEKKN